MLNLQPQDNPIGSKEFPFGENLKARKQKPINCPYKYISQMSAKIEI